MKSREQILSEQTGISIHKINHETVRASDALDAMEEYAQLKVNELNKSDVIKSVCVHEWVLKGKEVHCLQCGFKRKRL